MKRFYKMVTTAPVDGGYGVFLDGKPVLTPAKRGLKLVAPTKVLAEAIAAEWASQKEAIVPHSMPLTQILSTQIDRVSAERSAMTVALLKYVDTDLVCYRVEVPEVLKKRQEQYWDPALAWFEKRFGAAMKTTTELKALTQTETVHKAIEHYIGSLTAPAFTVFQLAASAAGSLILAAAFTERQLSADDLFAAIRVEEAYKAELYDEARYGPDPAQSKKDKAVKADLEAAEIFLNLIKA